jgi:hypothetical protein
MLNQFCVIMSYLVFTCIWIDICMVAYYHRIHYTYGYLLDVLDGNA